MYKKLLDLFVSEDMGIVQELRFLLRSFASTSSKCRSGNSGVWGL